MADAKQFDKQETPRTDGVALITSDGTWVPVEFASQLERELADVTDRLAGYERHVAVLEGMQEIREEEDLSARGDIERLERELAALRLLKDMDALEASAFGTFLKGGDIPATIDAARGALVRRMLEGETIIRALIDPNNVNPVDGDDVKAMLRFGKATDAARAFLHKTRYVKVCAHGKALNDYCEPCGRIHGG